MERLNLDGWAALFDNCQVHACHLQMRDHYALEEELADIAAWRAGDFGPEQDAASKARWLDLMRATTARGPRVMRTRIVSVPVTEFIRFEHEFTPQNIGAGEEIRWLPRMYASPLALPGNDCWIFDGRTVVFNHFTGNGAWLGNEVSDDPAMAVICYRAFWGAWSRAIPHEDFALL